MKSNHSSKSSSLSPNHIKSNQNNKTSSSTQKNKNNSDNIKISNESNFSSLKERVLKIVLDNSHEIASQKLLERIIFQRFNHFYSNDKDFYFIKVINEIICNESTHIVAEFKDYLISGDYSEFLQKSYNINECRECLPKIYEYYDSCSVIFPNYVILPESKYIYKNIQRKQRVIDNQQDLEEKQEKIKKGLIKINDENEEPVFTTDAIDSILEQTDTSGIKAFFGVKDSSDKNISVENIINKISTAINFKTMSDGKNNNCTLKKMKESEKIKLGVTMNLNHPKIKGRNYNRYLDGGYNSSTNNNIHRKINTALNVNSTISNGMKNTKVSSTTIEMDSKNFKNNIPNKESNTVFVCNNTKILHNKNNINSIKKPNLVTKLLSYNNKEFVKKIFKEMSKKNSNNSQYKKPLRRNLKAFSPKIEKSNSKNKRSNSVKKIKQLSSSLSSPKHKNISSYNSKKTFSISKIGKIPHHSYNKSLLSYKSKSKSKEKNENLKSQKTKENSIPHTDRESRSSFNPELMLILNSKINKIKNLNSNKKISMSISSNKKTFSSSSTGTANSLGNNKQKEVKKNIKKYNFRNKKNIINGDSLLFNTNTNYQNKGNKRIKSAISSCFSLSPKKSPDYNKILKNFNHIHSSNTFDIDEKKKNTKMTKNTVFPKKDIKRIQINGLNDLLQNSNSNSRNNSNSERIIFNEALTNKISRTNRNNNNLYSKTYLDICKKKF